MMKLIATSDDDDDDDDVITPGLAPVCLDMDASIIVFTYDNTWLT